MSINNVAGSLHDPGAKATVVAFRDHRSGGFKLVEMKPRTDSKACWRPYLVVHGDDEASFYNDCGKCPPCCERLRARWVASMQQEVTEAPRTWFITYTWRPDLWAQVRADPYRWKPVGEHLKQLSKRLERKGRGRLRYCATFEVGAMGLPHYHALLHVDHTATWRDVHDTARGKDAWAYGFVHARLVDRNDPRAGEYVGKYVGKQAGSPDGKAVDHALLGDLVGEFERTHPDATAEDYEGFCQGDALSNAKRVSVRDMPALETRRVHRSTFYGAFDARNWTQGAEAVGSADIVRGHDPYKAFLKGCMAAGMNRRELGGAKQAWRDRHAVQSEG